MVELTDDEVEVLARLIHEEYLAELGDARQTGPDRKVSHRDWSDLDAAAEPEKSVEIKAVKSSNRRQARSIAPRLRRYGYTIVPVSQADGTAIDSFPPQIVEQMARDEHSSWMEHELNVGNIEHGDLVHWDALSEETKDKDRDPIRNIPAHLKKVDYAVVEMASP